MRSVYLNLKKSCISQADNRQVNIDNIPDYLLKFLELNETSMLDEITDVLQFLSHDQIITHDLVIKFFELTNDVPNKLYSLLRCDYTYQFIADILVIYFSETNFIKHIKRIYFDFITTYQENFLIEMFSVDEIMLKFVFQINLLTLYKNQNYNLLNFISKAINAHASLKFSQKQFEIDQILHQVTQSTDYIDQSFNFLKTLVSDTYNQRIVQFLLQLPQESIHKAIPLILELDEESITDNANSFFNIAIKSLSLEDSSALKLLSLLLFHSIQFEYYECNFSFIIALFNSKLMKTASQCVSFLIDFIDIFYQIKPTQLQILIEDFNIMKLISIFVQRLQNDSLEFTIECCKLIQLVINLSEQQMDTFLELRFDIFDSLCCVDNINYCDDFLCLRDEYCF
ncbi:hypothetical protein SS50377_24437 [Spironucleus salmonicida]|uniref:Uncharacterized protein n=1 Tax=Spironucleus salmonicida TaxID=348837 RepID=V6LP49_9EUKA|nr:hypothetical protein SS50377_24437 [Spironucleus salmonicida]|eukprot:EST46013.1 Hypothetical protein SS50377_14001 [Spironucleus salmonicida]